MAALLTARAAAAAAGVMTTPPVPFAPSPASLTGSACRAERRALTDSSGVAAGASAAVSAGEVAYAMMRRRTSVTAAVPADSGQETDGQGFV